jgi:pilus assembly protein CpaB
MGRSASVIILLVAVAMGGLATFLANNWLKSHSTPGIVEDKGTIVVANSALSFGTPLGASDLREVPWPKNTRPDGAFSSVNEVVKDGKRIVLSPFVQNEPIVASKITGPNGRASLSTVIEEGKRAVTVAVDDVKGVAGFIFPGDFVDVALTRTNAPDGPSNYSEVILQHVKVLAIDQVAGDRQDRPTVAKAVTLEVSQDEALKILLAVNIGKLSLILRQTSESAMTQGTRITVNDLYAGGEEAKAPLPLPAAEPAAARPAPVVIAEAREPPPPPLAVEPTTRKVTVVRSMKSQEYEVPRDQE